MDWEDRYKAFGMVFGEEPSPLLVRTFQDYELASKLDKALPICLPGDGYGRNGLWLADLGYVVDAYDLSSTAVSLAHESAREKAFRYKTIASNSNDYVLAKGTRYGGVFHVWCRIEDGTDRMTWNSRIFGRLAPGALIVIITSTRLTSAGTETSEWPKNIDWLSQVTQDDDLILVGTVR